MASAPHRASLTEGEVGKLLVRLGVPMALGIVFIIALDVIDTIYVGMLGTAELAAISFCAPVISMVISASMGLGVGATSTIARAIGHGDEQAVRRLTTHSLLLAFAVVAVLASVGLLTDRWLFAALGAEGYLLEHVLDFMRIWLYGAPFLVIPMVGTAAIRATGDTKTPMWSMFAAALANGVLDPIMIFGWGPVPALGLEGAAWATLLARFITLVPTIYVLGPRLQMLEWRVPRLVELWRSWRTILSVGLPALLTYMLAPLAAAVLIKLISEFGEHAVAAWGVGTRIEALLMIPALGLSAAITPFIGQNWAAERHDRIAEGMTKARRFMLAWGLGVYLLLALAGRLLGSVFSDDPEVLDHLRLLLWIVPVAWGAGAVAMLVSAAFNAIDKAMRATALSLLRSLVLAIPLAMIGERLGGLAGLFVGVALAIVLTAVLANGWAASLFAGRVPATER